MKWRCELDQSAYTVMNCIVSTNWRMLRLPKQNPTAKGTLNGDCRHSKYRLCIATDSKYSVSCLVCGAEYRQPEAWLVAVWACHLIPHHTILQYSTPHHSTPHHNTPHHTTLHHTTPYHTIRFHTLNCASGVMPWRSNPGWTSGLLE